MARGSRYPRVFGSPAAKAQSRAAFAAIGGIGGLLDALLGVSGPMTDSLFGNAVVTDSLLS